MDGSGIDTAISLERTVLDALMPMHVIVGADRVIAHTGPTLAKVWPGEGLAGRRFCDVFALRGGQCGAWFGDHDPGAGMAGGPMRKVRLRDGERTQLIGTAVALPRGQGMLVNLSFGIAVVDAVARYHLAGSDFAATDLTLEMLYLVEAKSAAMEESRKLNLRLQGDMAAAEEDAASDMLTGLRNRRVLDQVLGRMIARGHPFTLMHLDLDYFKSVNDTLGHAAGDHVLMQVARILTEETRVSDTVARVGGDEFVLVFDGLTERRKLVSIARRVIERLEQPIPWQTRAARISGSIGMTMSTLYDRPDVERMMQDADAALYDSKERGRACYTVFDPVQAAHRNPPVEAGGCSDITAENGSP